MTAFEVVLTEYGGVTVLTPWVTNLSFRSVDPGGFGSATFDLSREIDARGFEEQADVAIYNAETGEAVGGGRMVNPGRGVSRSGEVWNISLLGEGVAHMQERKEPYILVDRRTEPWYQGDTQSPSISWSTGGPPDDSSGGVSGTTGMVLRIEDGASIVVNKTADVYYYDLSEFPDAILGGYGFNHVEGGNTSSQKIQSISVQVDGGTILESDESWSLTLVYTGVECADVADPVNRLKVRYKRTSGTLTATENSWSYVVFPHVLAMRYGRDGALITTAGTYLPGALEFDNPPTTDDVVIDVWARFCPRFDLLAARVDESAMEHRDLVWPDGITPLDVLAQLKTADPGHTWAVWEKQPNGLFRTEWRAYDTDVRYEMTAEDGFSETSAATKYVKVFAAYDANTSNTHHYNVFSYEGPDEVLAARGIRPSTTVAGPIYEVDLEAMLDESELEAGTAQVTVGRKVYDHYTGRWVEPFQVLPGYLCRVAGVNPQPDWLNVNQVPGAAVFKVVSNDYSVSSASSRLELNAYTVDERRAIANLLASQR